MAEYDNQIVGYACYMMVANESHLTNIAVDPTSGENQLPSICCDRILEIVPCSRVCDDSAA